MVTTDATMPAKGQVGAYSHLGGYVHGSDPNTWYPELWSWLKQRFGLGSVLDVGCGEGHATRYWQSIGCDSLGIDGSPDAIRDSAVPEAVRLHDFTKGPFQPNRAFDAIWCCEVVEHIDERYAGNLLDTFALGRVIAMTHGVPGQVGHHHVNCQPSSYWVRLLGQRGYHLQYGPTREARARTHSYFAKTGMIFTRDRPVVPPAIALALLKIEWVPRRIWRRLRKRGLADAWRSMRR